MSTRFSVAVAAVLLTLVTPGVALADIVGAGPDESPSQAYGPLVLNTPVAGAFVNQSDVDLLAFTIATAGETRYFTLANTTTNCQDPNDAGCPVYATAMDQTGVNQIGGPSSDAGTIATARDTETFAWTFPSAGTYYIELESDGDLPAGTPTYRFTVSDSPPGSVVGTGPTAGSPPAASTAPLIESLHVATRQRGGRIRMLLRTGRKARRVRTTLTVAGSRSIVASKSLFAVSAGRHLIALTLPPRLRRRLRVGHPLKLVLVVTAVPPSGTDVKRTRRITAIV
ncbi:MAG TPA: hypothetical protein VG223_12545 [Solirubrobacteraceae bacterium]|nr:hypothetical protein [Solirubrobacteraceae bacterium]